METKRRLFLVDGDNHVLMGLAGVKRTHRGDNVQVYITQPVLQGHLSKLFKGKLHLQLVPPGNQAVDNMIKSYFANAVIYGKFAEVYIISHDKGYLDLIEKYRKKGVATKMALAHSIRQAIKHGENCSLE